MKFLIHATERTTGKECGFILACSSAEEAKDRATGEGFNVRDVKLPVAMTLFCQKRTSWNMAGRGNENFPPSLLTCWISCLSSRSPLSGAEC